MECLVCVGEVRRRCTSRLSQNVFNMMSLCSLSNTLVSKEFALGSRSLSLAQKLRVDQEG